MSLFIFIFFLFFSLCGSVSIPDKEREAVKQLFEAACGNERNDDICGINWSTYNCHTDSTPVECNVAGHVRVINIPRKNLTGTLKVHKDLKEYLLRLDVSVNQLTGTIPDFNGGFDSLLRLFLQTNQFYGTIPDFKLPALLTFRAQRNRLTGEIPNFSHLSRLTYLSLWENQLSGDVSLNGHDGLECHLSQPTNDDDETSGTLRENNCFDSCPELDHGCAESCRKVLFPCLPPTTLSTTEITTKPPTTTTFVQPVHPTTVNTLPSEQTTVDTTPAMASSVASKSLTNVQETSIQSTSAQSTASLSSATMLLNNLSSDLNISALWWVFVIIGAFLLIGSIALVVAVKCRKKSGSSSRQYSDSESMDKSDVSLSMYGSTSLVAENLDQ